MLRCSVVSGTRLVDILAVGPPRAGCASQWPGRTLRIKSVGIRGKCFVYMAWDRGATSTLLLGENVKTGVNTVVPAGQIRRFS